MAETESTAQGEEHKKYTHHFSDIDVWKHPDRSYYLFITLSVLFGFLGFDHFYLRSFGTGLQKLFVNLFTFGLWYFWDLVQICFDGQKVRTEGLDSPFEWVRGIGRGVFVDPKEKIRMMADPTLPVVRTKKDIVIYALLTVMFGIFGFDKLYMGQPWQAVTKFLSVFNILFFLFGLLWVLWDIVHIFLYPETVLQSGITPPLPFSLAFDTIEVKDQFIPEEVSKEQIVYEAALLKQAWSVDSIRKSHFWIWNWDIWVWNWSIMRAAAVPPGVKAPEVNTSGVTAFRDTILRPAYQELVVPVIQPSALTAIQSVKDHEKTIQAAGEFGKELLAAVPKITKSVTDKIAELGDTNAMIAKIQAQADAKVVERTQAMVGGSNETTGPIIAGTLMAIVLAGGCKAIIDILSSSKKI